MIKDPFIFQVLDISTGHMTKEDSERLTAAVIKGDVPVYELSEYGWLIYVGELEENWPAEDGWSTEFRQVLREAQTEHSCDYVRFDRDGREYDEFRRFDW